MTRGEKINNPMNIRISENPWQGKITPSSDPDFEQFDTVEDGIRAGAKIILSYYLHEGLSTPTEIISRWAPSTENNTTRYIGNICEFMSVNNSTELNITDPKTLANLVTAIIRQESGEIAYTPIQIALAVSQALS